MYRKLLIFISLAMLAIFAGGCQTEPNPVGNSEFAINPETDKMMLDIPAGATLDSAVFNIYVAIPNRLVIDVHRATIDWEESGENGVTWNSFGGGFAPEIIGSFTADYFGWRTVDLGVLVQSWLEGSVDNYGILLDQAVTNFPRAMFNSRENPANKPFLKICYTYDNVSSCDTVYPLADAYISEATPDVNSGLEQVLFTGWGFPGDMERQSLLKFALNVSQQQQQEYGAISDFVWFDENMNGIQDAGETGLAGVEVQLYDCLNNLQETTVTDVNGFYLFDSLLPGDYYVVFIAPEGYLFSDADLGGDDALDSDADPATGATACTTIEGNENDTTWDAGLYSPPPDDPPPDDPPDNDEPDCTRTIGYWKNHAGFGPQDDMVTQYLPIWLGTAGGTKSVLVDDAATAADILGMKVYGKPSNGITKLYAQLLATKLNIAAGADDADIADALTTVDDFLAENGWGDWDLLGISEKISVLIWKTLFDNYNNGQIGPGHCEDADDDG